MTQTDPDWPRLTQTDQDWPRLTQNDQDWLTTDELFAVCQPVPLHLPLKLRDEIWMSVITNFQELIVAIRDVQFGPYDQIEGFEHWKELNIWNEKNKENLIGSKSLCFS